jgi:hypothetical protein
MQVRRSVQPSLTRTWRNQQLGALSKTVVPRLWASTERKSHEPLIERAGWQIKAIGSTMRPRSAW